MTLFQILGVMSLAERRAFHLFFPVLDAEVTSYYVTNSPANRPHVPHGYRIRDLQFFYSI